MHERIKIGKGLDIPLKGAAEARCTDMRHITLYGIQPSDYVGLAPRLEVREGDRVEAGQTVVSDKNNPKIRLTSPVCGTVKEVRRGERRVLDAVVIEKEGEQRHWRCDAGKLHTRQGLTEAMTECGLWAMLKQRPFGVIANPDDSPRDIFVSLTDTAPLAPDLWCLTDGREKQSRPIDNLDILIARGLDALALLTEGTVHVCGTQTMVRRQWGCGSRVVFHEIAGPHPSGNVGTQIAAIAPINKGERVWTMNAQDVATLGHLVETGEYRPERLVAVTGPAAAYPQYYRITAGASVRELLAGQVPDEHYPRATEGNTGDNRTRIISGNVLSGHKVGMDGFVGAYDSQLTLIEEGDRYTFMGWLMPGVERHSFSRTFVSGILESCKRIIPGKPLWNWHFDTNKHGGERPLVFSGDFERVFPFDIYPTQLIKAAIIGDIELMEELGIYEVEPEDFALCEYIDPSKTEIQSIIRNALERCRKEAL